LAGDGSLLRRVESDRSGTFEFEVRNVRAVRLRAERLGYKTNTTPILHFDGRSFFQVEVRLDPEAILLAPLEVIAWSEVAENVLLEGFRERAQRGFGTYITREQIVARNPNLVTDLLRGVPGVQVMGSGSGIRPVVRMGRASSRSCATQIYVDGFLINRRMLAPDGSLPPSDFRIDDFVAPMVVEGIEVYQGLSGLPAQFLNPDADCGVIAIWTRRGGAR
jgi:outer membrane receptor for ferrienterochelin and colicin